MKDASLLTVEAIYLYPESANPTRAEGYAASLSDPDWTNLRASVTRARKEVKELLLCGDCRGTVYPRESTNGRRHFYHFGQVPPNCIWAGAHGKNSRAIDAEKFHGNQESARHKQLKSMLCQILALTQSDSSTDITQERYTKGKNKDYAYPDVFFSGFLDNPTIFELQLATTQLPTITRREDFYLENQMTLTWLIDSSNPHLDKRTFKDIYLRNDGQIFGLDEETLQQSIKSKKPHLKLHRLLPSPEKQKFLPVWKSKIVSFDEINWIGENMHPVSIHFSYDEYFKEILEKNEPSQEKRVEFFNSLASDSLEKSKNIWNDVCKNVGGLYWNELGENYDTLRALGVLATLLTGKKYVNTAIEIENLANLINSVLLEPLGRRVWTNAFVQIAKKYSPDILLQSSIVKKISRNQNEEVGQLTIDMKAGQVFNFFFPIGAFSRLILKDEKIG